jgi:L-ascorbate metabolism protein UlaG (beta-lactamase superfamily)
VITPFLQDDALLADIAAAAPDALHVWWLGQSGFLVRWNGRHLLFDPYLSDSLTKKYAASDKPHTRMTERVIAPERLDFIDLVTSSHNHTDHLDAETLIPILQKNPAMRLVVPEANNPLVAERLKIDPALPIGLDDGTRVSIAGFEIYGIAAAHNTVERDEAGHCKFLGCVVKAGPWTIYHSGDTLLYDGLAEKLAPFRIDIALLPINGNLPERRVAGNLDGREAAELAHRIGSKVVVPCHFEMFEFNTASPELFVATCESIRQPHRVLRAGERLSSSELSPL